MRSNKFGIELDFLIFSIIALLSCAIIWICLYFFQVNEKYKMLGYSADKILSQSLTYDFQNNMQDGEFVYLNTLVDSGYINHVSDPFSNAGTVCNEKESYIVKKDNIIYITFNCGDYWLINYSTKQNKKIYKIKDKEKELVKTY